MTIRTTEEVREMLQKLSNHDIDIKAFTRWVNSPITDSIKVGDSLGNVETTSIKPVGEGLYATTDIVDTDIAFSEKFDTDSVYVDKVSGFKYVIYGWDLYSVFVKRLGESGSHGSFSIDYAITHLKKM